MPFENSHIASEKIKFDQLIMSESLKKTTQKEKSKSRKSDAGEKNTWSEDQKKKSYYYDDAHGYEVYRPEETDEEDARN